MKVLLIGGCGFLGSHVADCLLAKGHEVRILDRRPEPFRQPLEGVEYRMGDFGDRDTMVNALEGVEAVMHLASTTVPQTANLDPVGDIEGNLISTVRMLELLRTRPIRKFLYLSSGGTVYGIPQSDLVNEDHPLRPISCYGIVKVAVENYLLHEHVLHGLDYVVLRASNPYGPRQGGIGIQGIIGTHMWKVARNEPLEIWGDGSIVRDFIHVRDLAELCVVALQSDATGCFNAGSGTGTSIGAVAAAVAEVVSQDSSSQPAVVYKPGRPYDVPRIVLDIGRAQRSFGWTPTIPITEGLKDTWEWVREQASADVSR